MINIVTGLFGILTTIAFILSIVSISEVQKINSNMSSIRSRIVQIPRHAKKIHNNIYRMKSFSKKHQKMVDGFIFISHSKNQTKFKNSVILPCTGPILAGARWRTVENYMVDSTNENGMSDNFVKSTIQTSIGTWITHLVSIKPLNSITTGTIDGIDVDVPDGKNEILFGHIDVPNVIAMTIVWISGNSIIESDQIYNDVDYTFGNSDLSESRMDLQNIATHEIGHALGLKDIYTDECSHVTMFGSASIGETDKRTLTSYDIDGLKHLYGELSSVSEPSNSLLNAIHFSIIFIITILILF